MTRRGKSILVRKRPSGGLDRTRRENPLAAAAEPSGLSPAPLQPSDAGVDVHAVTRLTGIEQSRIRFYELEFSEFLRGPGQGGRADLFDAWRVELLRRIDRLLFEEKKAVSDVRRELRQMSGDRSRALQVVVVTSGKGGVGKTTVSISLAVAFARRGLRTLLFDADLGLGNVHVLAGIRYRLTVLDLVDGRASVEDILTDGPGGIKVLCAGSGVARMADLDAAAVERLGRELTRLAGLFDVIVVDTGAGIAAQVIEFLRMGDDIVLVATPDVASMLDAYGVVKVARENGVRAPFHVLVNQVEQPGQPDLVYGRISACARRFLNYEPLRLGHLERDPAIQQANQDRTPLPASAPLSPVTVRFDEFAASLSTGRDALPAGVERRSVPMRLFVAACG